MREINYNKDGTVTLSEGERTITVDASEIEVAASSFFTPVADDETEA